MRAISGVAGCPSCHSRSSAPRHRRQRRLFHRESPKNRSSTICLPCVEHAEARERIVEDDEVEVFGGHRLAVDSRAWRRTRFCALWPRAWSTSTRRIAVAATPRSAPGSESVLVAGKPRNASCTRRGRLQRVVDTLGAHRGLRQPAQLAIEHVEQRGPRAGVARRRLLEEPRHLADVRHLMILASQQPPSLSDRRVISSSAAQAAVLPAP
jgi:hypothetical protein